MVGGERDPDIGEADLVTEEIEKVGEVAIESERHGCHLRRIGPDLMSENIVRRKADGEQVGGVPARRHSRTQLIAWRIPVRIGWRRAWSRSLRRSRHRIRLCYCSCDARWSAERLRYAFFHSRSQYFAARSAELKSCAHLGKSLR